MWRAQASPRAAAGPSPLTLSSRRSVVAEPTRLERDTAGASGDRYETNERPPSTTVPLTDRRGGVNGLSPPSHANGAGPAYGPKGSGYAGLHRLRDRAGRRARRRMTAAGRGCWWEPHAGRRRQGARSPRSDSPTRANRSATWAATARPVAGARLRPLSNAGRPAGG